MTKVLLIYATMTGNTEEMADLIETGLVSAGLEVDKKDVEDAKASDMEAYSHIILGAYTWGDGDLPDEFLDFFDDLEEMDLSRKFVAVFGSGDTGYEYFCGAVDTLEEGVKNAGGSIVQESLKVDIFPEDENLCKEFGLQFAQTIKQYI